MKGLEYHILSHTHWDREWYLTYQQFRRRLVHLIDRLLEILESDSQFKHFHLDGQTIPLEDYLAVRPENEKRLSKLIKQGRIAIGPWYVQNDTFLVDGESTIRNLYIGHQVASRFGKSIRVGYLPDQFGNISQMPQILNGFGIKHAVFGRGYKIVDDRTAELEWSSPDGSKVFALFLPCWYCNFIRPSDDVKKAVKEIHQLRDLLLPTQQVPLLLLMNGCDHVEAQSEIGSLVTELNKQVGDGSVVHTQLEDFLKTLAKAVKKPTSWKGEFREDYDHKILAGTLSSRVYLKQANHRCETALLTVETLQWLASQMGCFYDQTYLQGAWKLLMQNQAHDSICGCSIDPVHREMIPRFEQVEQMAEELRQESLEYIGSHLKFPVNAKQQAQGLLVFNPLTILRREALDVTIDFPISDPQRSEDRLEPSGRAPQYISILDEQGETVPIHIHGTEQAVSQILSPNNRPHSILVQRFFVQIPIEMGPLQYRSFQVLPKKGKAGRMRTTLKAGNNRIENNLVQVMAGGDGSVSIRDKKTGHLFGPLVVFDDGGDVGDSYLYRCPDNDRTVTTLGRPAQTRPVITSPHQGTLQIERIVTLPESADLNEQRRERGTIDCMIATRITLKDDDPTLYCETRLDNHAQHHRLRSLFQSNLTVASSYADSPFDVIQRPLDPPEQWNDAAKQSPMRSFAAIEQEELGLAVFTRGLHEYQVINSETGTLALTLLRCVGHLSRERECFRKFETPDAQCLGRQRFEFAVHIYHGPEGRAQLPRHAQLFSRPLIWQTFEPQKGSQDRQRAGVSVDPLEVLVTAVKRCEERESTLIRLVNTSDQNTEAQLNAPAPIKEAHRLDLLEKRKKKLTPKGSTLSLPLKAKEIVTVELVF